VKFVPKQMAKNEYRYTETEYMKYIDNIKKIYNIEITEYDKPNIYNLIDYDIKYEKNSIDLLIFSIYDLDRFIVEQQLYMFENQINLANIFIGMLIGLKYTKKNGTFILFFGSVAYKHLADIYLILSKYFEKSDLYYPEISNLYKKTGTYGIFRNFKGISQQDYNELLNILEDIKKIYPNGAQSFNIYTPELRKRFQITKPIDNTIPHNHITGFLNIKPDDTIYNFYVYKVKNKIAN
jgi:hypothetical protein